MSISFADWFIIQMTPKSVSRVLTASFHAGLVSVFNADRQLLKQAQFRGLIHMV